MRLRVPSRRHDAPFFAHLQKQIETIPKIESSLVTPKTASVLLRFAEGDASGIDAALEELGILSVVESSNQTTAAFGGNGVDQSADSSRQTNRSPANGGVDRRALAFTVLLLLLLRQLLRGGWLAPGLAFVWLLFEVWQARRPQAGDSVAQPHNGQPQTP